MLRPLNDRVLIKRRPSQSITSGGIYIPDAFLGKANQAIVVAAGPGKRVRGKRIPLLVKPGDEVLIGKWAGQEITLGGEECLVIREEEILAVLG